MSAPRLSHAAISWNVTVLLMLVLLVVSQHIGPVAAWVRPSNTKTLGQPPSAARLYYRNRALDEDRFASAGAATAAVRLQQQHPIIARRTSTTATLPIPPPMVEPKQRQHSNAAASFVQTARNAFAYHKKQLEHHIAHVHNNARTTGMDHSKMKNLALSQATLLSATTALAFLVTTVLGSGNLLDAVQWIDSSAVEAWVSSLPLVGDAVAAAPAWMTRLFAGGAAAVPMIALSHAVDSAQDNRDMSHHHFSTTQSVLSLFGRRTTPQEPQETPQVSLTTKEERQPDQAKAPKSTTVTPSTTATPSTATPQVILSSMGLSALTSVTEEVIFRGYVPALILALTQSPLAAFVGQAVVFGLGHLQDDADAGENRVAVATQTLNGLLGYGLAYVVTGGDLIPCIIAHALYDMHVWVSSWHKANTQMEWTEASRTKETMFPGLTPETVAQFQTFFYAFDTEHRHALSLANVQRALSYVFWKQHGQPQPTAEQVEDLFRRLLRERDSPCDQEHRIDFNEFVRLLLSLTRAPQSM